MAIGGDRYREAARLDTAWVEAAARAAWGERAFLGDTTGLKRLATRPGLMPGDRETVALILNYLSGGSSEQGFELARRRAAVNPERWLGAVTVSAVATGRANIAVAVSGYADSAIHMAGGELFKVYAWRGYALHERAGDRHLGVDGPRGGSAAPGLGGPGPGARLGRFRRGLGNTSPSCRATGRPRGRPALRPAAGQSGRAAVRTSGDS